MLYSLSVSLEYNPDSKQINLGTQASVGIDMGLDIRKRFFYGKIRFIYRQLLLLEGQEYRYTFSCGNVALMVTGQISDIPMFRKQQKIGKGP